MQNRGSYGAAATPAEVGTRQARHGTVRTPEAKPRGSWRRRVLRHHPGCVYTDQAWQSAQDPDHDVAFLRLSDGSDGRPIEEVTGAERLGVNRQEPAVVQVIGYPDGVETAHRTEPFRLSVLR